MIQVKDRRIVLLPLDNEPKKIKEKPNLLVQNSSAFVKEMKEEGSDFAMVVTEKVEEATKSIPAEIQKLSDSFPAITKESEFCSLPPIDKETIGLI